MPLRSAGLLPVRLAEQDMEFFLVHPGGPFFRKKDDGAWSIPKGLVEEGEDPLAAAQRELREETGFDLPPGPFLELGQVRQSAKVVQAWAVVAAFDPARVVSNTFDLEWPPRSGKRATFPEVDRAAWFPREVAEQKLLAAQRPFLHRALALTAELFLRAP